jgi:uncharacterized protein YjbI with pentapeptide repeats
MHDEIRRVLKMNKEGTLTDAQAAELLSELARPQGRAAGRDWERTGLVEPILSKVNDTLKYALDSAFAWDAGGARGYQGKAWTGSGERNSIHMSRFEYPEGEDIVFSGNSVRMSSVKDLRLERAEMTGNTIDMSKADDLRVVDGRLKGCEIRASSVDEWRVEGATLEGVSIQGSRVAAFHCAGGSELGRLRIQGASLKALRVAEGSVIADTLITGSSAADVRIARTRLRDSEIQNSALSDVAWEDGEARNLMVRGLCAKQTVFAACAFEDAVFTADPKWSWKKHGFKDVRFERCSFERVLFSNCRITDCVIRNVTLKDRQFRDLDLSGLRIDGEAEFLKAAGR